MSDKEIQRVAYAHEGKLDPVFTRSELDAMINARPKDVPKVTEDEFVRKWLPIFFGAFKNQNGDAPIGLWVNEVSLSPSATVDVIDRRGKVLYQVPPIVNQSAAVVNSQTDHNRYRLRVMLDMLTQQRERGVPLAKNKELAESWLNLIQPIDGTDNVKVEQIWMALYLRYGFITMDEIRKAAGIETADEAAEESTEEVSEMGYSDEDID